MIQRLRAGTLATCNLITRGNLLAPRLWPVNPGRLTSLDDAQGSLINLTILPEPYPLTGRGFRMDFHLAASARFGITPRRDPWGFAPRHQRDASTPT